VSVDLAAIGGGAPEDVLDRAGRRVGAPPLSDKTREYILDQLREAPPPAVRARAVGLLLGAPELQRR
jgi:hypothetical protein